MKLVREYGLVAVLGALIGAFGLLSPVFLTAENLLNIVDQVAIIGFVALGMTVVILTGGIDLSVGSTVAFTGIIFAESLVRGFGLSASMLLCVASGLVVGALNGFLIAHVGLPAFIVTLGTMGAARGASLYITDGRAVSGLPASVGGLASTDIAGLSLPAALFLCLTLLTWAVLKFTYWGKFIYAIGGNERAAWLSGIAVERYKMMVYVAAGFGCAVSGAILVSKLNSAQPQAGNMYELNAIAAVVLGGASLAGGRGDATGTFLGVMILGVLQNGFSLLNVSSYYQQMMLGAILIAAVYADKKSLRGALDD